MAFTITDPHAWEVLQCSEIITGDMASRISRINFRKIFTEDDSCDITADM